MFYSPSSVAILSPLLCLPSFQIKISELSSYNEEITKEKDNILSLYRQSHEQLMHLRDQQNGQAQFDASVSEQLKEAEGQRDMYFEQYQQVLRENDALKESVERVKKDLATSRMMLETSVSLFRCVSNVLVLANVCKIVCVYV